MMTTMIDLHILPEIGVLISDDGGDYDDLYISHVRGVLIPDDDDNYDRPTHIA